MVGDPSDQESADDAGGPALAPTVPLTDTQLRILAALCRPAGEENRFATPATNQEIADEVYLSVDAVKAHLRTLYRKFGIEDLPHNRKRARLLELVLEGGYLGPDAPTPVPDGSAPLAAEGDGVEGRGRGVESASGPRHPGRGALALGLGLFAAAGVAVAVLALAGAFSGDESGASTAVGAYKAAVDRECDLALSGQGDLAGASVAERALSSLELIETMRGGLESVPPPATVAPSLERFRDGLARAATYNRTVAGEPPAPGSPEQAKVVSELTFAAGQVQAGAVGYGLDRSCRAIGEAIASSAANAASAP